MLRSFVDDWNTTRPREIGGRFAGREQRTQGSVSAVSWLVGETGIPKSTIEQVAKGRYRTTELRVADALVAAIGHPEAFYDGTLEIRPATKRARCGCCGGSSLNGSLG